jgi:hypothetical protein
MFSHAAVPVYGPADDPLSMGESVLCRWGNQWYVCPSPMRLSIVFRLCLRGLRAGRAYAEGFGRQMEDRRPHTAGGALSRNKQYFTPQS